MNPAQLGHLLHVNDYICNQLVGIKSLTRTFTLPSTTATQHQQQHQQKLIILNNSANQGTETPHSFNPHNYTTNLNTNTEVHHQLHHSHPVMPPVNNSSNEPVPPLYSVDCYCCPTSSSNHQSQSNHEHFQIR